MRDAELEPLRFHDLRHTAASLMIALGTNIKVVKQQLGHKTAAMTPDVYADFLPGRCGGAGGAAGPRAELSRKGR